MIPEKTNDHLSTLRDHASAYAGDLAALKQKLAPAEFWYPYGSMANFACIEMLLTGANRYPLCEILSQTRGENRYIISNQSGQRLHDKCVGR
jgi:hypothetical protein